MSPYLFHALIYSWIALALIIFIVLRKINAPYGRHSSRAWGPMIGNRLAWMVMEIPVLIVLWGCIGLAGWDLSTVVWCMAGLFSVHYLHRSVLFPWMLQTRGKQMPLIIMGSGVVFNLMNGFLLGYYFAHLADYTPDWFTDWHFITGLTLFLTGMVINIRADYQLIGLRKKGSTEHYVIPRGWLFEKISCPNHFGEMIEWMGFAILTWSLPAVAFFIWTAANLIPRAMAHHKWYRDKFVDYPKSRKAIIPYFL